MKAVASLFGGGSTPKVSTQPAQDTEAEQKKAKKARSALLATEGGVLGTELEGGQVSQRSTIFGN